MSHYPAGSSLNAVIHFSQLINAGVFQRFDFGHIKNIIKYGQVNPPLIDISGIKDIPIVIVVGTDDEMADAIDSEWLY